MPGRGAANKAKVLHTERFVHLRGKERMFSIETLYL
jgi:hypothetical protein